MQQYDPTKPATHQGNDLTSMTASELLTKFGLNEQIVDFVGHALALYRDDDYLPKSAMDCVMRIKLYYESLTRFSGLKSPYIYPLYGLGELP